MAARDACGNGTRYLPGALLASTLMGIREEDIAKVRSAADIVQIIGEHTEIKRSGRNWMARCPMHGERTPSLSVSPEKGVYYCFGCRRSGDVFSFVQEIDNLDFVGAVEWLANRYGIRLNYTSRTEGALRTRKRELLDSVSAAADFYHGRLLEASDAGKARSYLRSRGYDGELVRRYRIGWAPDSWDQLAKRLQLSDSDLRDSGLGFVNSAGRQQDAFSARVMFPILDDRGDTVGFGGRILPGRDGPKYKNTTTESVVYDKGKVLYGLHTHRDGIVRAGEAIICEGYTDVIGFATAGIDRAVATCGAALTEDHVKLLKRFSADRLLLSFDADAAGRAAAERVYAWERQYELDVRVVPLPPGTDPDDLARNDPVVLKQAVDEAVPLLRFRLERSLDAGDLSTVEGRARAAQHALGVISEHPDLIVRDQYLIEIADRCRIGVTQLREMQPIQRSAGNGRAAGRVATKETLRDRQANRSHSTQAAPEAVQRTRITPEDEALRLVIHRHDEVSGVLTTELFGDPVRRQAFTALTEDRFLDGRFEADDVRDAADRAGPEAGSLLRRLAVDAGDAETTEVLARLADTAAIRAMNDLRRGASATKDPQVRRHYVVAMGWLKSKVESLADRDTRSEAVEQLLPWLSAQLQGSD